MHRPVVEAGFIDPPFQRRHWPADQDHMFVVVFVRPRWSCRTRPRSRFRKVVSLQLKMRDHEV